MSGNTNFRRILMNKCQKEFEKERLDDIQMVQDEKETFENVYWIYSFCTSTCNVCFNSLNRKSYQRYYLAFFDRKKRKKNLWKSWIT